jgi:hypothetical protein
MASDPIQDQVQGHVYDAMPSGTLPQTFIALGAETVSDASDQTGHGALHSVTVSVITSKPGFMEAKQLAGVVGQTLLDGPIPMAQGRVVFFNFLRAAARRDTDSQTRRIDMVFQARLEAA